MRLTARKVYQTDSLPSCMNPFHIDPRHLPADGKQITGTLPGTFFKLAEGDPVQVSSPLKYDLNVIRDGDDLIILGSLEAEFSLECGRCLERFPHQISLAAYQAEIPVEKEDITDLTDLIREDILLTLPNFPRCEDGNVQLRVCPAEGRFDTAEPSEAVTETPGNGGGVWDALDQIKKN